MILASLRRFVLEGHLVLIRVELKVIQVFQANAGFRSTVKGCLGLSLDSQTAKVARATSASLHFQPASTKAIFNNKYPATNRGLPAEHLNYGLEGREFSSVEKRSHT